MHVDIVKNEWLAGFQLVVARLHLETNGTVRVDTDDDDRWRNRVLAPYEVDGERYDPHDGESFLRHLHKHFRGDYLFATELHDDTGCPLPQMMRPIERVEGGGVAHTIGA